MISISQIEEAEFRLEWLADRAQKLAEAKSALDAAIVAMKSRLAEATKREAEIVTERARPQDTKAALREAIAS
jgi:hypothetical protein